MSNTYFQFKKFIVHQDKCAMKVGTDGVLLGAWADVTNAAQILDVGTGTGLVALMLAQRADNAFITAVEIDKNAALQAEENINLSQWKQRMEVLQTDFRKLSTDKKYDLIVSNPPYFTNSLQSPDDKRNSARHDNQLTHSELLSKCSELLSPSGKLAVIVPVNVCENIKQSANSNGLYLSRQTNIVTVPGKEPKRCLMEFSRADTPCSVTSLVIEEKRHVYSNEFKELLKDFYLNI